MKNASIHEVAEMCYVSAPTISRFCKRLGYESYSSFKNELSQAVSNYNYNNRFVSVDTSMDTEDSESASFLFQIGQYSEALKKSYSREYIQEMPKTFTTTKGLVSFPLSLPISSSISRRIFF